MSSHSRLKVSYLTTDGQSASLTWYQATIKGTRPVNGLILFRATFAETTNRNLYSCLQYIPQHVRNFQMPMSADYRCYSLYNGFPFHLTTLLWVSVEDRISYILLLVDMVASSLDPERVRFEIFTAVTIKNAVFWDVTPCGSCRDSSFEGT
jgi:hypothetical protein